MMSQLNTASANVIYSLEIENDTIVDKLLIHLSASAFANLIV